MRYGIVGLGATGQSVLRHLLPSQVAWAWDTRADFDLAPLQAQWPKVAFYRGALPEGCWDEVDALVVSPGISVQDPALAPAHDRGLPLLGDVELFAHRVDKPVIAITGSNGKSTVTTLVAQMLQAAGIKAVAGGNLGTPALDLLVSAADVYVLELSSFQLETTYSLQPASAALLNISEDHMDRYASLSDYVVAKARIFQGAARAVVPPDWAHLADAAGERVRFTLSAPARPQDFGVANGWLVKGDRPLLAISEMVLPMAHMQLNALAALALVAPFGVDLKAAAQVAARFEGLPHRTQRVPSGDGIVWINDSKGTNVGATLAALESFSAMGPVILVAGGVGKGQDFTPLATAARACKQVVLFGEDGPLIAEALVRSGVRPKVVDTLEAALQAAQREAMPGDVVLFSPACASFDQFDNYQQRGEAFCDWVRTHAR